MVAQLGRQAVRTTQAVGTSEVWWVHRPRHRSKGPAYTRVYNGSGGVPRSRSYQEKCSSVGLIVEYYILPGVLVCRYRSEGPAYIRGHTGSSGVPRSRSYQENCSKRGLDSGALHNTWVTGL